MNRISLCALAASLTIAPLAAKADTVLNLNATTGNASTSYTTSPSYAGGYNNLAPSFYQTLTLGPGTYTVSAIGSGVTGSNGVTSVYSGFSFASTGSGPAPGTYTEMTGIDIGGTFSNASAANGYQNSYTAGAFDTTVFNGAYNSNAAALAAAPLYTFTLASTSAVTFYASDGSYLPNKNPTGYDDNSGGVSLSIAGGAAVTPEPSSLVLLGTGVLSLAGAVRRRFRA